MNEAGWSKLSSIAEIVSSIAIVISLIYVGYEINMNSRIMQAANRQSIASRIENMTLSAAINPGIGTAFGVGWDELSPEKQSSLNNYNATLFRNTEEAYLMYLEGFLPDDYWQSRGSFLLNRINTDPISHIHWENYKQLYTERFRNWLDGELLK